MHLNAVSALSKEWDCGRSLIGIAGSNPAVGMDACLLWVLCQVKVYGSGWLLVQGSPAECSVSECDREATTMRRPFLEILYEVLFVRQELACVLTGRNLAL